MNHKHHFML